MAGPARVAAITLLVFLSLPIPAAVPELRQPNWGELTPAQRQILAPLAHDWDKLESYRKKKWLGIASRYPSMLPAEQARVQRRMQDWVQLTPAERKAARDQYRALQKASPEKRENLRQKWEQYADLPEAEKKRLAEEAKKRAVAKSAPKMPVSKTAPLAVPASRLATPQGTGLAPAAPPVSAGPAPVAAEPAAATPAGAGTAEPAPAAPSETPATPASAPTDSAAPSTPPASQ